MPKIKNKFIIFVILIITLILSIWIFQSFYKKNVDVDSYVILLKWQAILNSDLLELNNKQLLSVWDTVRTIWKSSLAVLEWWDGSLTRLWGDSSIKIEELYVSNDIWTINIWFKLLSGKSWSNIISFLWEDSYFKEFFRDSEAAARWTIFAVDLNNDYLSVTDHKVELINNWKTVVVEEKKPFNIRTFKFIDLEKFITELKDNAWESINAKIDEEFFAWLKTKLSNDINELNKFRDIDIVTVLNNPEKKEELYNKLLWDYQKFNFIKSDDKELFTTKLELKEKLVKLADDKNKNILIENTLYDFKDIISKKEYSNIGLVTWLLSDNKEFLWNIDFKEYFTWNVIPEDLKNILKDDLGDLKNIFWENFIDWFNIDFNINLDDITNKWDALIQGALDNWLEKIDNLINK